MTDFILIYIGYNYVCGFAIGVLFFECFDKYFLAIGISRDEIWVELFFNRFELYSRDYD